MEDVTSKFSKKFEGPKISEKHQLLELILTLPQRNGFDTVFLYFFFKSDDHFFCSYKL